MDYNFTQDDYSYSTETPPAEPKDEQWKDDLDEVIDDMDQRRRKEQEDDAKWEGEIRARSAKPVAKTCYDPSCVEKRRCRLCVMSHYDEEKEQDRLEAKRLLQLEEQHDHKLALIQRELDRRYHATSLALRELYTRTCNRFWQRMKRNSGRQPRRPQRDLRAREVREIERLHRRHLANVADFRQGMENWRYGLSHF